MARNYAQLLLTIWAKTEWRALPHTCQWLYELLISQEAINYAGVQPLTVRRWATLAADIDEAAIWLALKTLCQRRYLVVDEDTEEVLVRSFIRNGGIADSPNMLKSAMRSAAQVVSPLLRSALRAELQRVDVSTMRVQNGHKPVQPMYVETLDALADGSDSPPPDHGNVSPSEGHGEGFTEGFLEPLGEPRSTSTGTCSSLGSCSTHIQLTTSKIDKSIPDAEIRQDVEDLCTHLRDRIVGNGAKATITAKWRTDARLLLDRDHRPLAEAHRLIDWCQQDPFWRSNILSLPKFRAKYDQLRLRATPGRPVQAVPDWLPTDPVVAFDELRRHGAAQRVANLIGKPWIEPSQPPSDRTPHREWIHTKRVAFIDHHEPELRAALATSERSVG